MKIIRDYQGAHRFAADGSYRSGDQEIPYKVISEETVLGDENGEAEATIYSFSYFRTDVESAQDRPVIFVFNGGPGASSIWMHLGFMAPKRLDLEDDVHPDTKPPFKVTDNQECLLDTCDLVMIDPVETGFARLIKQDAAEKYFGVREDALAISMMIHNWLIRYDRFNSPKYILGESYGTIRAPFVINELTGGCVTEDGRLSAIPINGVMMLGTAIFVPDYETMPAVYSEVYQMLAWAATNWYHHPDGKPEMKEFIEEAWNFASSDYLMALYAGNAWSDEKRKGICEKLEYYTGVCAEKFLEADLHLDNFEFSTNVLKKERQDVGIYDGRYTLPHMYDIKGYDTVADDPAMGQYVHSFVSAFNAVTRKDFGIETEREYRGINFQISEKWNTKCEPGPLDCLRRSLRRHRTLKAFFGSGLFDLCCHPGLVRYMTSHYDLPKEQMVVKEYASGHMPYLGDENRRQLVSDMRAFIEETR